MKPMSDRKMDMRRGEPESNAFFPEDPHYRDLPKASEVRGFKYPDTDQAIHADQEQMVKNTSSNMPKPGFRH